MVYGSNTTQALTHSLAGFAHANKGPEWFVVVPILHQSSGIWDLNGQQQKHLRHMTKIMDSLINAAAEALDTNRDSSDRSDTERDLIKK